MQIGAQLYTVRAFTQNESDLESTLGKVAAMGYPSVQISAIGPIPADKVRTLCDRHGLAIAVTHTDQMRIINDTERVIEEHRIMGARHVGIGSMPNEYRTGPEGVDRFIRDFTPAAETIARAGLKLHYHNHDFEFARYEGQLLLQRIADGFSTDLLGFILDTFWIQAAGGDPAWWIRHLSGRVEVVHLKDFGYKSGKVEEFRTEDGMFRAGRIMLPVGDGNMNFPAILDACGDAGTEWLMVEQDTCVGSPFDCLKRSYAYLGGKGY